MNDQMREEFEASPRFKGMDFTRSSTHPEFYESPYANGAWDGWKASAETKFTAVDMATSAADGFRDGAASVVVEFPDDGAISASDCPWDILRECKQAVIAAGGSVKP